MISQLDIMQQTNNQKVCKSNCQIKIAKGCL